MARFNEEVLLVMLRHGTTGEVAKPLDRDPKQKPAVAPEFQGQIRRC
jgi:hypothetical protein